MKSLFLAIAVACLLAGCGKPAGYSEPMAGRATKERRQPAPASEGTPLYRRSECVGPVIMGECQGAIVPDAGPRQTCHGEIIAGQCTGPTF